MLLVWAMAWGSFAHYLLRQMGGNLGTNYQVLLWRWLSPPPPHSAPLLTCLNHTGHPSSVPTMDVAFLVDHITSMPSPPLSSMLRSIPANMDVQGGPSGRTMGRQCNHHCRRSFYRALEWMSFWSMKETEENRTAEWQHPNSGTKWSWQATSSDHIYNLQHETYLVHTQAMQSRHCIALVAMKTPVVLHVQSMISTTAAIH